MKPFTFVPYDPSQAEEVLPRMFDILSGNMSAIAPTGRSNEEDRETWLAYMASEQGAARRVLLLYAGEDLAGYFQYGVEGDALCVDEIEISPAYQRTLLFYRFCRFAAGRLGGRLPGPGGYQQEQPKLPDPCRKAGDEGRGREQKRQQLAL